MRATTQSFSAYSLNMDAGGQTRRSQRPKLTRRQFLKRAMATGIGLAAVDALLIEPGWLAFGTCTVPIRGLPKAFNGFRIALLSDFHIPHCISAGFVREACELAMAFQPDLIALSGDFVHSWDFVFGKRTELPDFSGMFDALHAPHGVFGVLGNHDHWLGAQPVRDRLKAQTPIKLLDGHTMLERDGATIALCGLDDLWQPGLKPAEPFEGIPEDTVRILLQHNPDLAEEMPEGVRVDLQLSGHTHGGHVRLPFLPSPVMPSRYGDQFREGLVEGKRHRVYVTRGVGTATPIRARFFARPEVSGLTLVPA